MKIYLYIILLFLPFIGFSQSSYEQIEAPIKYNIAYFGNNVIYPGATFGIEYPWRTKVKVFLNSDTGEKKIRHKYKQRSFTGDLGFYYHDNSHVCVFTSYGVLFRRTFKYNGYSLKLNPLGYYRAFLKDTYEVKDGEVKKVTLPGRSYYAPSMSIGIGRFGNNVSLKGMFGNFNMMILTPYNAGINVLFSTELGYSFGGKKQQKL